jgi:hypothetical protein
MSFEEQEKKPGATQNDKEDSSEEEKKRSLLLCRMTTRLKTLLITILSLGLLSVSDVLVLSLP